MDLSVWKRDSLLDDEISVNLKQANLWIATFNACSNKNQTEISLLNKSEDAQSKLIKEQSQRLSMKIYAQKDISYLSKEKLAEYANIAEQRIIEWKTKNSGDKVLEQQASFGRGTIKLLSELKSIEMLEKRKRNIIEFPFYTNKAPLNKRSVGSMKAGDQFR